MTHNNSLLLFFVIQLTLSACANNSDHVATSSPVEIVAKQDSNSKTGSQNTPDKSANNNDDLRPAGQVQFKELAVVKDNQLTNSWITNSGVFFSNGDAGRGILKYISFADSKISQVMLRDPLLPEEYKSLSHNEFMSSDGKVLTTIVPSKNRFRIYIYNLNANGDSFAPESKLLFDERYYSYSGFSPSSTDGKYILFSYVGEHGQTYKILNTTDKTIQNIFDQNDLDSSSQLIMSQFIPNTHHIVVGIHDSKQPSRYAIKYQFWDIDQNKIILELPASNYQAGSVANGYFAAYDAATREIVSVDLQNYSVKRFPARIELSAIVSGVSLASSGKYALIRYKREYMPGIYHPAHVIRVRKLLNDDSYEIDIPQDPIYNDPGFNFTGGLDSVFSPDGRLILDERSIKKDGKWISAFDFDNVEDRKTVSQFPSFQASGNYNCTSRCFLELTKITYSPDSRFVVLNYLYGSVTNGIPTIGKDTTFYSHLEGFAHQVVEVMTGKLVHESFTSYDSKLGVPDFSNRPHVEFFGKNNLLVRDHSGLVVYTYL
nr:hypothetical protein HAGR004_38260 [Bdellovibrio sp. HAGR004]